ncbi:site-specific integrase [Azospirillum soli]|uniref:site-specific integrase n=1 Tax=Azospirillum soli TaxID=1304799 RepID=UPI001AE17F72|nr:site-specific integrase [Azospirillum soli]MBP2312434.1 integrase [Azospirillum soli]
MTETALTNADLDELARRWFAKVMEGWENRNMVRPMGQGMFTQGDALSGDPVAHDTTILGEFVERARKALANNDFAPVRNIAEGVLQDAGLTLDPSSTAYARLCRGLLRAQVEYFRLAEAWRGGDFSVTPADPLFAQPPSPARPTREEPKEDPRAKSMPLPQLVEVFIETQIRDGKWKPATVRNNPRKLRLFAETLNGKPVDLVTRDDIRNWRDVLTDLDLAPNTIGLHFRVVTSMFNWAKPEGKASIDNPLKGLAPKGEKRTREAFTPEDLKTLFHSPLYTGHWRADRRERPGKELVKDHKFWLPLVALHSGLRVEEAAKLTLADLREEEGVWCFCVNNAKTDAGNRIVPVHPRLIRLGLLDHRAEVERSKGTQLWPELRKGSEGRFSQGFVQWWSSFRHLIGLDREGLVFHSFRHTFISTLLNSNSPEIAVKVLVGHASQDVTKGTYGGKLLTPQGTLELIQGLDFGADLSHLLPAPDRAP